MTGDRAGYAVVILINMITTRADLEVDISRQYDELLTLWKTGKRQIESGRVET